MDNKSIKNLNLYKMTVVFSVFFTLIAFSYNVWRMEVSEKNNNIRTASFEVLINLSSLEQLVYTIHYDGDEKEGSPRKGWVKVGLIVDLSTLTDEAVNQQAERLRGVWSENWSSMAKNENSMQLIVNSIDSVREEIKSVLSSLD